MEKRIGLELRGRKPEELTELNLDNCKSPTIDGLTDKFSNLEVLSLNSAGLTTLKGFPTLPKLRKLEVSDNRISGGLNALSGCSVLKSLNLSGNRIKELEALKPLSELTNLRNLDLFHCEVTNLDNYREEVFKMLPGLVGLDGFDKNEEEVEDSDEELNGVEDEEDGDEEGAEGEEDDEEDGVEDDDGEEEEEDDEGDEEEDEVGLSAIYKDNIGDGEDDEDFDEDGAEDEEDEDDDVIEEEDEAAAGDTNRGKKRKHEEEEEA
ncbi:Acidic leucine-rich nuclear phosphoprotein 32 family member A [Amphibalanus amphitrite]|uniref:Acidic leucine-rich nuclear phosphoprotein 32 family member A n=1 Tax=Amphibalanus amphitrite TaxID=1232801 RepID=A0A6A4WYU8_AMPAM|nr:Acidic leucine-rich nuclear phosphoprotein 32 family member A [Amphibalanus amphitrite]